MKKDNITFYPGKYKEIIEGALAEAIAQNVPERIWQLDHTVWSDNPEEITNRLGWLFCPDNYSEKIEEINAFAEDVKKSGVNRILLLGMGGSSLAPEVFSFIFGQGKDSPELSVIDSTHPEKILEYAQSIDPEKTFFIVSTKSGTTVETLSFMKYFYTLAADRLGIENAGKHFAAITDPGSKLEKDAKELGFRKTFINDPNIGGRYSVLSFFGLVPAALCGVDISRLLKNASEKTCECGNIKCDSVKDDSGTWLGAAIGELALSGKDKLSFVTSEKLFPFVDWAEQLIAESVGKTGKGILPVPEKELKDPGQYEKDRAFVIIHLKEDSSFEDKNKKLEEAGFPVLKVTLDDIYDLGGEFFRWEYATAVAGWRMGVQPFDQPNVESAKKRAKEMLTAYSEKGKLPDLDTAFTEHNIEVVDGYDSGEISGALKNFFEGLNKGNEEGKGRSYCAVMSFVNPGEGVTKAMLELKEKIENKYKLAVTYNYGPRFLHSTGQLHKGDEGEGLFIQFVSKEYQEARIPDEPGSAESSVTFGSLIEAQAMGDRQALLDNNRRVITFNLNLLAEEGIRYVASKI